MQPDCAGIRYDIVILCCHFFVSQPIRIFPVGPAGSHATAAAFSPDGKQLMVGLNNGGLKSYEFHPETKQVTGPCVTILEPIT